MDKQLAEIDNGELKLEQDYQVITCSGFSDPGAVGGEEVGCFDNSKPPLIGTYLGVNGITLDGKTPDGNEREIAFQNIQSPITIDGKVQTLVLDYRNSDISSIQVNEHVVRLGSVGITHSGFVGGGDGGRILLPEPSIASLVTTVGGECDSEWEFYGHSNLVVNANEVSKDCKIVHYGGTFAATLTVDFGDLTCSSGYKDDKDVKVNTFTDNGMQFTTVSIGSKTILQVGDVFQSVQLFMSQCDDTVSLLNGVDGVQYSVDGRGGNDIITVGGSGSLAAFNQNVYVSGGPGDNDVLNVNNGASSTTDTTDGRLDPSSILGLLGDSSSLFHEKFDTMSITLGSSKNN